MRMLLLLMVCASVAHAQEAPTDPALVTCRIQVAQLAQDLVAARLEALRKSEEYRAYEAAVKRREALKPPAPAVTKNESDEQPQR